MSEYKFIKADIGKLESFVSESEEAIREFASIRNEFDRINRTLLNNWQGSGKESYQRVANHIAEKVGGIKEILDTINDKALKDIIDKYHSVDAELGEYNRHAGDPETKE